jgi:hypothetical protein
MQPSELPTANVWKIIHYYDSLKGKPIDYLTVQFNFLASAYEQYWDTKCKPFIKSLILHQLITETSKKKGKLYHITHAGLLEIRGQSAQTTEKVPFCKKSWLLFEEQTLLYTINVLGDNATRQVITNSLLRMIEPRFNLEKQCRTLVDQALITLYNEGKISRWKVKSNLYYSIKTQEFTAIAS